MKRQRDDALESLNPNLLEITADISIEFPFKHAVIPDFLSDNEFATQLRMEVLKESFSHKSNDLYEFFQSMDLAASSQPAIQRLRKALYSTEFVEYMSKFMGIKLSGTVDLSAHRYPPDGYLLCHDDDIGSEDDGRKIAFILYLVQEDWKESEGGRLQLFDCNDEGDPSTIVKSIIPNWNSFGFFQVLPTSHHQVEQVYGNRDRVSISGWFHGPKETIPKTMTDPLEGALKKWLNPAYLSKKSMEAIALSMMNESFVQLQKFLAPNQYSKLCDAITKTNFNKVSGIPNAGRWHQPQDPDQSFCIVSEFRAFMSSDSFSWFAAKCSGLDLIQGKTKLRSFLNGDYTLMNDKSIEPSGLDALFQMPCGPLEWDDSWGGGMETLLSLYPNENTMCFVMRDDGTLRFIKMVNRSCRQESRLFSTIMEEKQ